MANTKTSTLSIRIKADTKKKIAKIARMSGRSSNLVIAEAVEAYLADQERVLAEIRESDRGLKTGHFVSHEDMKAWLLSWGTANELPPPRCACGRAHDDEAGCR